MKTKLFFCKFLLLIVLSVFSSKTWGQTYFDMSVSNYSQDFTSISSWSNSYASGTGAEYWKVAGGTVFTTGTTGGVQKGTQAMLFLATGTATTTTDLLLDFTNVTAGTLSLDWAKVVNPTVGTKDGTLKLQYSVDGGGNFTDFTGYTQPVYDNSNTTQNGSLSIALPSVISGKNQVVVRFVVTRNSSSGSGNNPKVQIDNIVITRTAIPTGPTITITPTTALSLGTTICEGSQASANYNVSGSNLTADIVLTPTSNLEISNNAVFSLVYTSVSPLTLAQTGGSVANTTIYVRNKTTTPVGAFTESISHTSSGATTVAKSITGTVVTKHTPTVSIALTTGSNPMCGSSSTTFTATANGAGNGTVSYQWKKNGINVGTSQTYNVATPANGDVITCDISIEGGCVTATNASSNSISLVVNSLPATPSNPTSNSPQCNNVTLTRGTSPVGETWYWQTTSNGTSTANSNTTYSVATSGTVYLRAYNNTTKCWSASSANTTVVVNATTAITSQPASQSTSLNGTATFSVVANGSNLTYQWEIKPNGSSTWTSIAGATASSYTIANAQSTMAGDHFRVAVTGTCGPAVISDGNAALSVMTATTGDYRTNPDFPKTEKILFSSTSASGSISPWQRYNGANWVDVTGSSTTASPQYLSVKPENIFINHPDVDAAGGIGTGGNFNNIILEPNAYLYSASSTGLVINAGKRLEIQDKAYLMVDATGKLELKSNASLIVRSNGRLDIYTNNPTTRIIRASDSNFIVESNGEVVLNNYMANIWTGNENFAEGSYINIHGWEGEKRLFVNDTDITNNAAGAKFGHLYFEFLNTDALNVNWTKVFPSANSYKLTSNDFSIKTFEDNNINLNYGNIIIGNDFIIDGTGSGIIQANTESGAKQFTVNGNVVKKGSVEYKLNSPNSSTSNMDVKGNVTISEGKFKLGNSETSTANVNLYGDLKVDNSGILYGASSTNSNFNFVNTTANKIQAIDAVSTISATDLAFNVNSGAQVQLLNNDLALGSGSKFTVATGGTFDFNLNPSATTAYKIVNATGTLSTPPTFTTQTGSITKITSADGITKSAALGNVQVTGVRTYSNTAEYQYVGGRAPMNTGDALQNTGSASALKITVNKPNATDVVNVNTTLKTTSDINILKGTLVEPDATNSIQGTSGNLIMSANATYKTAAMGVAVPQLTGTYTLASGSTIELNAAGNQIFKGGNATTYRNLVFSNSGIKKLNSATENVDNVKIANTAIVDAKDGTFMTGTTVLNMLDTSKLIVGIGTDPKPRSGSNNLASATSIEFADPTTGITSTDIRLSNTNNSTVNYANLIVSGKNVGVNSTTGGVTLQAGTNFHVTNTGIFKVKNSNGFSGAANTAVKNTNSPSITLDAGSTVDYTGVDQSITHQIPYANLSVSSAGVKTATGTTTVNQITTVSAGKLKLPETANNVTSNILEAKKGIHNTGGTVTFENNAILMQDAEAINTGDIILNRKATVPSAQYNLWSSPVASQDLYALYGAAGAVPADTVMEYITKTDLFKPMPTGSLSVKAKAYSAKGLADNASGAVTAIFKGEPNNGEVSIGLSVDGKRFNAVGNPYPSNLDLNKLYDDNTSILDSSFKNITNLVRFWDNTNNEDFWQQGSNYSGNNYAIYNLDAGVGVPGTHNGNNLAKIPDGIVKPGQGFMVRANTSGDQVLKFNNGQRLASAHADTPYYKNSSYKDRFWLALETPGAIVNTIAIAYNDLATNNNDIYDTSILDANNSDLFYSLSDNQYKQAIQSRKGGFVDTDAVKLGAKYYKAGTHKIKVIKKDGVFEGGQNIYLHDKVLNKYIDLATEAYSFDASASSNDTRFEIVYKPGAVLGAVDTQSKDAVIVYKTSDAFVVLSKADAITKVELYDMNGRLLQVNDKAATEQRLSHEILSNGMYLLKISRGQNVEVKKVLK